MILNHDLTREDAERKAKKTSTDGKVFYEISESTWKEKYGQHGLTIYRELAESKGQYVLIPTYLERANQYESVGGELLRWSWRHWQNVHFCGHYRRNQTSL